MQQKKLINQLELAYAPLTAFEYANLKDDPSIEKALENASLYVIAQRPVITFENVIPDQYEFQLNFEIHQKGNLEILKCKLPLSQKTLKTKLEDRILIAFNNLDKSTEQGDLPYNNIHGFTLLRQNEFDNEFLVWFSPEKLLHNYWKGYFECEIIGNFKSFIKYNVHYVGKATKQNILKRLSGHSTFQDILSLESPVTEKQIPANEIVILPFKFRENIQIQSFGPKSDIKSMVETLTGENFPKQEKVFLDAEKALIKAMQPRYNRELFKKYPISKDGLYNDNYDLISYSFRDPITLIYKEGKITGSNSYFDNDIILILNNKEFRLVKNK